MGTFIRMIVRRFPVSRRSIAGARVETACRGGGVGWRVDRRADVGRCSAVTGEPLRD